MKQDSVNIVESSNMDLEKTKNAEQKTTEYNQSPGPLPVSRKNSDELIGVDGRKLMKLVSRKSFGSSTTISATEASDDSDDHLSVVVRVRPLNKQETARNDTHIVEFPGGGGLSIDQNGSNRNFAYNVAFEPEATQEDLFVQSGIKRVVDMAINGYSATCLAFGQTGSGKTHTMTGPPQVDENDNRDALNFGIMQRSFDYLMNQIKLQTDGVNYVIKASYLEIYNEQVIDLINPSHKRPLAVRWSKNKGFYVENLFVVECETTDDLMAVLEEGLKNRQVGSHGLNEFSSRSHSMMSLMIDSEVQNSEDENLYITKRGKLTFVDLAGSEKVKLGSVIGGRDTLIESKNINKSLLVLGNCISALGDAKKKHGHIPYRDSKLTKLLADSLSGNGVTLMIACITPSSYNVTETLNTLRYANRAKKIRSKPVVKMDPREHLILNLKKEMKVLRNENQYLRQQLEFPAKPKGQLQKENDKRFFEFLKQEKIANGRTGTVPETGLYEMLQEYMVENEALRSENANLHATRDQIRREQQLIYRQNERLQSRVEDLERLVSKSPINVAPPLRYGGPDDPNLGYDQSPRPSPPPQTYRQGGGPPASVKRSNPRQMPQDLPVIHPSLVTASPAKQPSKGRGRGQSMRPPHRLSDPVIRPQGREQPPQQPGPSDYPPAGARDSPRTQKPNYPVTSRKTHHIHQPTNIQNAESLNDINAKLRQELLELEGEIQQQAKIVHNPYPERHGRKSISGIYVAENVKT